MHDDSVGPKNMEEFNSYKELKFGEDPNPELEMDDPTREAYYLSEPLSPHPDKDINLFDRIDFYDREKVISWIKEREANLPVDMDIYLSIKDELFHREVFNENPGLNRDPQELSDNNVKRYFLHETLTIKLRDLWNRKIDQNIKGFDKEIIKPNSLETIFSQRGVSYQLGEQLQEKELFSTLEFQVDTWIDALLENAHKQEGKIPSQEVLPKGLAEYLKEFLSEGMVEKEDLAIMRKFLKYTQDNSLKLYSYSENAREKIKIYRENESSFNREALEEYYKKVRSNELTNINEVAQAIDLREKISVWGYYNRDLEIYFLLAEQPFDSVFPGLLNPHYKEVPSSDKLPTEEYELADVFLNELVRYSLRKYLGILDAPKGGAFVPDEENFNILYDLDFDYSTDFTQPINSYLIAFAKDFRYLLETYSLQRESLKPGDISEEIKQIATFQKAIKDWISENFIYNSMLKDRAIKMLKRSDKTRNFEEVVTEKLNREVGFWRKFVEGSLTEEDIQEEILIRKRIVQDN